MLAPDMFEYPNMHPSGMLAGEYLSNTYECENLLAWFLSKAKEAKAFDFVTTMYEHPELVSARLLEQRGPNEYRLTKKALGLLYTVYGK